MNSATDHTPADLFQTFAWAALTAVLVGYAIAEGSIGALVAGIVTLVQTWHAWTSSSEHPEGALDRFAPQHLSR
jgi:hypothetical protein